MFVRRAYVSLSMYGCIYVCVRMCMIHIYYDLNIRISNLHSDTSSKVES